MDIYKAQSSVSCWRQNFILETQRITSKKVCPNFYANLNHKGLQPKKQFRQVVVETVAPSPAIRRIPGILRFSFELNKCIAIVSFPLLTKSFYSNKLDITSSVGARLPLDWAPIGIRDSRRPSQLLQREKWGKDRAGCENRLQ